MKTQARALRAFAIAALGATLATAHAWTISSTSSSSSDGATVQNAPLAKTWIVTGDSSSALQALTVQSMGRVFIDYDASLGDAVAAKVIVSSDARDLLDAIEVVDSDVMADAVKTDVAGVKIHFQNDAFEGQGHVFTQVFVSQKRALRNVTMAWSSDVVVGSDVLAENDRTATVGLVLIGSGDFFAGSSSAEIAVDSLGVTLAGSGDVQLLAKSLSVATSLDTHVAGSGDIAVVADQITVDGTLSSLIAGSGDVFVQSDALSAHNLSSVVAGSGDITYSRAGVCDEQSVVVVGSGDVSTASIVCTNTFVNLVGSGDILVQTTESLTVASFFRGDVSYFGAEPKSITSSSLFDYGESHKHTKEIVRATSTNVYDEYDVKEVPERTAVYVVVKTSHDPEAHEPHVDYDLELATFDEPIVQEFLAVQQQRERVVGSGTWASVAMVGGLVVVAALAGASKRSRYRRHAYHAL